MNYLEHIDEVKEKIKEADKLLIGLGHEFSSTSEKKEQLLEAYQQLAKMLQDRDYFIVTLCLDDVIYESELDSEKIVSPCGFTNKWQCPDSCIDTIYTQADMPEDYCCPQCGKKLVANNVLADQYNENGYLPQWNLYTAWLQKTLNRKFAVVDLGTGMQFPSIIRFPFEKVVFYNEKAFLLRVNESIFQIPEEIHEKAYSYQKNAVDFLGTEWE